MRPTHRSLLLALPLLATSALGALGACNADAQAPPGGKAGGKAVTYDAMPLNPKSKGLAAKGKEIFQSRCSGCHGMEGEGRVGIGPALASPSFLAAATNEFLVRTISNGRAGTTMVPWSSSLSPEEISAVVAHIRTLAEHTPAQLNEAPLQGDAKAGAAIFSSICSRCHGRTGGGYVESSSGTGIGRKAFLDSVTNGYLRYIIKHGKDQTQMRPFDAKAPTAVANLDDKQIDDVIAYLRENAW